MEALNTNQSELKLYSQKGIGIATFLGSPLAASILIRHNYIQLDKPDEGKTALIIGILSTLLLFVGIFMIPEHIVSKFPNQVIPIIYTVVIYAIVERIQGDDIKRHEAAEKEFVSAWKAAGIGFICLLLIMGPLLGYAFYESSNPAYIEYEKQFEKFTINESESLAFYEHANTNSEFALLQELNNKTIPNWEENLEIIENTNKIEGLPLDLLERNKLLKEYCQLRIEVFNLFKKTIEENTNQYFPEIDELHLKIEQTLDQVQ